MINRTSWIHILWILLLFSCKAYRQDILFQVDDPAILQEQVSTAEKNYVIQPNDWLRIWVFGNEGEQLIDQNFVMPMVEGGNPMQNQQFVQVRENQQYLVQADGTVKLPQVEAVSLAGLTIDEAEDVLEEAFEEYYKKSFVKLQFLNKRVVVLKGQNSQVVPMTNERMTLPEILALSGGVQFGDKAQNIRIIRGDLQNPEIFMVDLTTAEGMRNSVIPIMPGDVIYVEPWRRPWREALRDASPVISVATSVATLVFLIVNSYSN
jgi:polysaccharide export outer membrane protein